MILRKYFFLQLFGEAYFLNALLYLQHSSMRCLSEVMDFFVSVAGPGTLPMKTNDRAKIFSKTGDPGPGI